MIDSPNPYAILFVDDEEKALKYFTKAFQKDFPVLEANSVSAAKKVLEEQADKIGVLVTDQRMPEANGVELLKHARQEYPQITRMLTTAYSDLEDAIEAVNRGEILRYISKPWDVASLKMELNQAMQLFLLRKERDQLMQEKLSAWQRMQSVNRVRDLLTAAAGITATPNAIPAIQALIEHLPTQSSAKQHTDDIRDVWGALQQDILNTVNLVRETLLTIATGGSEATEASTQARQAIEEAARQAGLLDRLELAVDLQGHQLFLDIPKTTRLFSCLFSWAAERVPTKKIRVEAHASEGRLRTALALSEATWGDTSLLNIPKELLCAYLICYGLSGTLEINPQSGLGLSIVITLPNGQESPSSPLSNLSRVWLEDALARFENWDR